MPQKTPVEVALEYFNSQIKGDLKTIEALLSPDFQAHTPWGPKSRAEALEGWGAWMTKRLPSSLTVRNVEEISHGAVLIEITEHLRPGPDDGREDFDLDVCDVIKVVDGRITGLRAYFDRTRLEQYYGSGPTRA